MIMITACFRDVHVDWLAAALRSIIVIIDVLLYWLHSDRHGSRLHEGLHVPHHDVLGRPQVPEFAINDTAVICCTHALCMRFLRVYHESTGPEVHIMQDSTGFNETSSVHIFQDANTVHGDNRSKAKANQSDGLTICKI